MWVLENHGDVFEVMSLVHGRVWTLVFIDGRHVLLRSAITSQSALQVRAVISYLGV